MIVEFTVFVTVIIFLLVLILGVQMQVSRLTLEVTEIRNRFGPGADDEKEG
jgi:hypothetical protein